MRRLVQSPEYKILKLLAQDIARTYRIAPGTTRSEDESYLTHCKIVWSYSTLFKRVEGLAKLEGRTEEQKPSDNW